MGSIFYSPPSGFFDIKTYVEVGGTFNHWKHAILNDGAGGKYVYGYQSKDDAKGNPIEVGVIRGNDPSIQPPSGWVRDNTDLNAGAGGDYMYFCYKRR